MTVKNNENLEPPVRTLLYLYSVIIGISAVTATKFLINPSESIIRGPNSIPLISFLSFLSFFCYLIPFYQGAVTYLIKNYSINYEEKTGQLLVDFTHLLGEGMIFYAISVSLFDLYLFISWLFILMIIDSVWILTTRFRTLKIPFKEWLKFNIITIIFILLLWIFYSIYPQLGNDIQGFSILFLYSFLRTIFDYIFCKTFYSK
jgi:hypothetical protein